MTSVSSPTEASPPPAPINRWNLLRDFVEKRVLTLQATYLSGVSDGAASLARLRRAAGTEPGADALVWQYTLDLPPSLAGRGDEASPAERAVHYSLTLFALHQQSQGSGMQRRGWSMGRAARQLARDIDGEEAVHRRFSALGTATSLPEALVHARGLIGQFRAAGIPLDYGLLAVDFLKLQDPRLANGVRLAWGRDYYRVAPPAPDGSSADDESIDNDTSPQNHDEGETP